MIPHQEHWIKQDILRLRNECKELLLVDQPPPRSIIQGKINIKHFIYQNEKLNQQVTDSLNDKSINAMKRKLKCRELHLIELRKRIDKLKEQQHCNEKTISQVITQNNKLKQQLVNIQKDNCSLIEINLKQKEQIQF